MDITVLNAVLCERVFGASRYSLVNVGSKWRRPPPSIGIWVELSNLAEREFTVSVQVWRGRTMIEDSHEELVLAGQSYWQSWFLFEGTEILEPKSYRFVVLIDNAPCRTMTADLGAEGSP